MIARIFVIWVILFFLTSFCAFGAEKKAKSPTPTPSPSASSQKDDESDDDDDAPEVKVSKSNDGASHEDSDDESEDEDDDDDVALGRALSGNVTLASDYILRGLSQTDHNPAVQGGFDWQHPTGFYLGVWGSNVHFQDLASSLELDGYGGYSYLFTEDLSLSLGAFYYSYWADADRNSWEIPLKSVWKGFSLEVDYSPRWQGENEQAWYLLGGWQNKVIWDVKIGLFAGYSFFSGAIPQSNYADFLVSASREFLDVEWKVSGVFVNRQVVNDSEGGSRAIFSVTKEL